MKKVKAKICELIWMNSVGVMVLLSLQMFGQESRAYFFGLQPAVTIEPFYEKGEFDVNIIPLVMQTSISKRIDFRMTSLFNYHFGGAQKISDVGVEVSSPVFLKRKSEIGAASGGFYIGPSIGFGKNFLNDHNTLTLALEPGYMFRFSEKFAMTVMLQYGRSLFFYVDEENINREHFGVKVNLGLWNLFRK